MSKLKQHAEFELKLAGVNEKNADYGGALYKGVMELIEVFSKQGHSGASAIRTLELFIKLARFENLIPIGKTKDEWIKQSDNLWQNKRNSKMFSEDAGKTWYDVNNKDKTLTSK